MPDKLDKLDQAGNHYNNGSEFEIQSLLSYRQTLLHDKTGKKNKGHKQYKGQLYPELNRIRPIAKEYSKVKEGFQK